MSADQCRTTNVGRQTNAGPSRISPAGSTRRINPRGSSAPYSPPESYTNCSREVRPKGWAEKLDSVLGFGWRICSCFWVAQRFTAAISVLFSVLALQFPEKLTFRIRASLQRCRKFFEITRPFRGWTSKARLFSKLRSLDSKTLSRDVRLRCSTKKSPASLRGWLIATDVPTCRCPSDSKSAGCYWRYRPHATSPSSCPPLLA
jgi:hypothetical protein